MSATIVCAALALVDGQERLDFAFAVEGGRIMAVDRLRTLQARFPDAELRMHGAQSLLLPGFINGHSHAYQILMRGWADDLPFERWRSQALYTIVPQLTPEQVYWTFRLAFDEMLAAGITTVAEFFYLNGAGNDHAREAIRAACDTGIRLIFARTWMDADSAPPQFRENIDTAAARTQTLMREFPAVHLCVAPHSLHAASAEMVRAAAAFARANDCMMHIHVAEAQYEVAQTQTRFGSTPIALLDSLNALNERTVAIHAIHITHGEQRMLAAAGARVIHNPMTNQYLGDGICDVSGLQALGVRVGLGTDADVKPSIIDEMRAAALLQKIAQLDGSALGAAIALDMGTAQGASALNIDAGSLREGAYADYILLDLHDADPWAPLQNHVVYRAQSSAIRETYVGGKRVRSAGESGREEAFRRLAGLVAHLRL